MAKIRPRESVSYRRPAPTRKSGTTILVVCEGRKTEPHYLSSLRDKLRLANSRIIVTGECGSDPLTVVRYAVERAKDDGIYDFVYCVFDKDKHPSYKAAVGEALAKKIIPITSVPCFELWVLLHFTYTTKPYGAAKGLSVCECVIKDLKKYIPNYEKGSREVLKALGDELETALGNAAKLSRHNLDTGDDNPSTQVGILVEKFFAIRAETCKSDDEIWKKCEGDKGSRPGTTSCLSCMRV